MAAGVASFASVFTFIQGALGELGRVHSCRSALSYGMGLAYGYVALAMGKHDEVRRGGAHPHATDEQAWIRGLDKARTDTIRPRLGHVQWRRHPKYRLHWPLS